MTSAGTRPNILIFCTDEQRGDYLGCMGHPQVQTPNIDRLASRGTLFSGAYTPSPICVSARAAFATGQYIHKVRAWDNVHPYFGSPPSWAHVARDAGYRAVSVGKLHYRSEEDDAGFEQIVPLHVVDGVGDVKSLLRAPLPPGKKRSKLVERIGPGETGYTKYDRQIADEAVRWISGSGTADDKPWALFVSFYCPHHPYSAPQEFYDLYDPATVEGPERESVDGERVQSLPGKFVA